MDINALAAPTPGMSPTQTAQAIEVAVLKKAMEIDEQSALQLLQAVPNNPPNLGNYVDQFV